MDSRQRIWNLMGPERRTRAAQAFWDNVDQKEAHKQLELLLAQRLHARPVFIRRLPTPRKAAYLAQDTAINPFLFDSVMLSYHFAAQRPMLIDYLNALGIAHDNGHYETREGMQAPITDQLETAVGVLLSKYDKTDVLVYLSALSLQDDVFWKDLAPITKRLSAEIAEPS